MSDYIQEAETLISTYNLDVDTIIFSNLDEINLMRVYLDGDYSHIQYLPHNDNKFYDKKFHVIKAYKNLVQALYDIEDYAKAQEIIKLFDSDYDVQKKISALKPTLEEFNMLLTRIGTQPRDRKPLVTALKNYCLQQ